MLPVDTSLDSRLIVVPGILSAVFGVHELQSIDERTS